MATWTKGNQDWPQNPSLSFLCLFAGATAHPRKPAVCGLTGSRTPGWTAFLMHSGEAPLWTCSKMSYCLITFLLDQMDSNFKRYIPWSRGPKLKQCCPPRDTWQCLETFLVSQLGTGGCAISTSWIEATQAAKHSTMHRTASTAKNSLNLNGNSVDVKKPCCREKFLLNTNIQRRAWRLYRVVVEAAMP